MLCQPLSWLESGQRAVSAHLQRQGVAAAAWLDAWQLPCALRSAGSTAGIVIIPTKDRRRCCSVACPRPSTSRTGIIATTKYWL